MKDSLDYCYLGSKDNYLLSGACSIDNDDCLIVQFVCWTLFEDKSFAVCYTYDLYLVIKNSWKVWLLKREKNSGIRWNLQVSNWQLIGCSLLS